MGDDLSFHFFFSVFFSSSHSPLYSIRTTCISELPLFILNLAVDIPLHILPKFLPSTFPQPPIPRFPHHASYVMIYFPNACQQDKFRLDTSSALLAHFTFSFPCFTCSEDYYSERPQSVNSLQHNSCQSINRNVSTHFCIDL